MIFNININSKDYDVLDIGLNLLQFNERIDNSIPRFCYHEELSVAGNCRMCLVELEGASKPVVACSTLLEPAMVFYTNNETVKTMREAVLEFLLINHPLDCPICDQGGECDLQDQTIIFGSDRGRFFEVKRSVEDKYFSPFIKTIMTRCIHCTRCIRYFDEVLGFNSIGHIGRGKNTEISTYFPITLLDELSGNVIDICPVGALTSKPYAFTARPWELVSYESIDILDSFNSNIRVDTKGNVIMRILPKTNEYLNGEWITDFIRFSYDGFRNERLTFPLVKTVKNNNILFKYSSWDVVFLKLKNLFTSNIYGFIHLYIGESIDLYSTFMLKYWVDSTNSIIFSYFEGLIDNSLDSNFLLTNSLNSLLKSTNFLILQLDLKKNISILNAKLKKIKWKYQENINVYYIGSHVAFNYVYKHIGLSNIILLSILKGKHFFSKNLLNLSFNLIKDSSIDLKHYILRKYSSTNILDNISLKSELIHYNYLGLNNYNILNNKYYDTKSSDINLYYLVNYNKLNTVKHFIYDYIIYQGTHGSSIAMNSNIILPVLSYMENQGLFMSLEGKIQISDLIVHGPGDALSFKNFFFYLAFKPYLIYILNLDFFDYLFSFFIIHAISVNKKSVVCYNGYNNIYNKYFYNVNYVSKVLLNTVIDKSSFSKTIKSLFNSDYYKITY